MLAVPRFVSSPCSAAIPVVPVSPQGGSSCSCNAKPPVPSRRPHAVISWRGAGGLPAECWKTAEREEADRRRQRWGDIQICDLTATLLTSSRAFQQLQLGLTIYLYHWPTYIRMNNHSQLLLSLLQLNLSTCWMTQFKHIKKERNEIWFQHTALISYITSKHSKKKASYFAFEEILLIGSPASND